MIHEGNPRPGAEFLQRFELGELLGIGASARVHRGVQRSLARDVAIKIFHRVPEGRDLRRIQVEAEALSRIAHPGVVKILELDRDPSFMYMVMELVETATLRAMLRRGWKPDVDRVLEFGCSMLEALAHVHDQDILHRDLKPENVFVLEDHSPKIVDFGLAIVPGMPTAHTTAGAVVGTPIYLAPEILLGEPHGKSTDLYAVGLILHEMLIGSTPFQGPMNEFVAKKHRPLEPLANLLPDLDRRIASVLDRCVLPDPGKRFASCEAFRDELDSLIGARTRPRPAVTERKKQDPGKFSSPSGPGRPGRGITPRDLAVSLVCFLAGVMLTVAISMRMARPELAPEVTASPASPIPALRVPAATPEPQPTQVPGGTRVYVENQTSQPLTLVTSPPPGLSPDGWRQLQGRVEPGERRAVLWLDREWKVISGKRYHVETRVTWQGRSVSLHQELEGLDINSRMWHGIASEPLVDIDTPKRYRWDLHDGSHIMVEYQARSSRTSLQNDDVTYVFIAPGR